MSGCGNPTPNKRSEVIAEALKAGHRILYGEPHTLQLDIDSRRAYRAARTQIIQFRERLSITHVDVMRSKSRRWHFYVRMTNPMERADRLFWQVALESDPVRGALDWLWMQSGHPEECFLIELADAKVKELEL